MEESGIFGEDGRLHIIISYLHREIEVEINYGTLQAGENPCVFQEQKPSQLSPSRDLSGISYNRIR